MSTDTKREDSVRAAPAPKDGDSFYESGWDDVEKPWLPKFLSPWTFPTALHFVTVECRPVIITWWAICSIMVSVILNDTLSGGFNSSWNWDRFKLVNKDWFDCLESSAYAKVFSFGSTAQYQCLDNDYVPVEKFLFYDYASTHYGMDPDTFSRDCPTTGFSGTRGDDERYYYETTCRNVTQWEEFTNDDCCNPCWPHADDYCDTVCTDDNDCETCGTTCDESAHQISFSDGTSSYWLDTYYLRYDNESGAPAQATMEPARLFFDHETLVAGAVGSAIDDGYDDAPDLMAYTEDGQMGSEFAILRYYSIEDFAVIIALLIHLFMFLTLGTLLGFWAMSGAFDMRQGEYIRFCLTLENNPIYKIAIKFSAAFIIGIAIYGGTAGNGFTPTQATDILLAFTGFHILLARAPPVVIDVHDPNFRAARFSWFETELPAGVSALEALVRFEVPGYGKPLFFGKCEGFMNALGIAVIHATSHAANTHALGVMCRGNEESAKKLVEDMRATDPHTRTRFKGLRVVEQMTRRYVFKSVSTKLGFSSRDTNSTSTSNEDATSNEPAVAQADGAGTKTTDAQNDNDGELELVEAAKAVETKV